MDYKGRLEQFQQVLASSADVAFFPISADLQYLTGIPRDMPNFGAVLHPGAWLEGAKGLWAVYAPGMSSRGDWLYAVDHGDRLMIRMGCWWGTLAEARERVIAAKGSDAAYLLYLAAVEADWQRQKETPA
mgnify:CR=1 FL=1